MSLREHALLEFKAAGWDIEDDPMQEEICNNLLELLEVFSNQGHSGFTAPYVIKHFAKLAAYEPIVPLTGEDWEWTLISGDLTGGKVVYQNKRCSRVFKQSDRFNGQAYDIDAVVFYDVVKDPDTGHEYKSYFTNSDSFQPIEFPYTPTTVYKEHI